MLLRAADVYVTIVRTVQSAGTIALVKWNSRVMFAMSASIMMDTGDGKREQGVAIIRSQTNMQSI